MAPAVEGNINESLFAKLTPDTWNKMFTFCTWY